MSRFARMAKRPASVHTFRISAPLKPSDILITGSGRRGEREEGRKGGGGDRDREIEIEREDRIEERI